MTDLRPLAIWTEQELNGSDWARIRGKVKRLNLGYDLQYARAVAGGPGRVLAIGSAPDFICDYALVPNTGAASMGEAILFALGENDDPRAVTVPEMLSIVLKAPVKEIKDAPPGPDSDQPSGPLVLGDRPPPRGYTDPNTEYAEREYRRQVLQA